MVPASDMNKRTMQTIAVGVGLVGGVTPGFAGTLARLNLSEKDGSVPAHVTATTHMPAEPRPKVVPADRNVALTVNLPLMWGSSIGVSAVVALADHHAVRFNGSRYKPHFFSWLPSEDGSPTGRNYDGSVSWIYFPRRVFTGATVEVGALYRDRYEAYVYLRGHDNNYDIASRILAAQALVGWNWRFGGTFYIATAVGASLGYEKGRNTWIDSGGASMTETVAASHVGAEAYLRFGAVFE